MIEINKKELERRTSIVNKEFDGIIPYQEVFYIHSILYSSERSIDAFNRYESLREKENNPAILISIVQEAVGHAAALSRYFWLSGVGPKVPKELKEHREKRAKKLRSKFGLKDDSPLNDRSLRNAWEHFDERLDTYLLLNDSGYFFPSPIIGEHNLADDTIGRIFKLLDTEAECLVLLGQKFFFKPIKEEVIKVYNSATNKDRNGGRL